jgi:putative flippase GtrA
MKALLSGRMIELIKYGFWGVITTIFNLFLFYLMIYVGMHYIVANVFSYFLAIILSFYLNKHYVFKRNIEKSGWITFTKFVVVRIISIVIDSSMLVFLVSFLEISLIPAKIFLSILIIVGTYIINRLFVFEVSKRGKKQK